MKDVNGNPRRPGESWLHTDKGTYLPSVNEEIIKKIKAYILKEDNAIHLQAKKDFKDAYGVARKAGDEWLITKSTTDTHFLNTKETFQGEIRIISLSSRQYCYVKNPLTKDGRQWGKIELRKGEMEFFLQPGEALLMDKIFDIYVLSEDEGLLLKAKQKF
jgi:major vault protein